MNKVELWVFPSEDGREWFVELESEEHSIILRTFNDSTFSPDVLKTNAIWYANKTAEVLGIKAVECGPRGLQCFEYSLMVKLIF